MWWTGGLSARQSKIKHRRRTLTAMFSGGFSAAGVAGVCIYAWFLSVCCWSLRGESTVCWEDGTWKGACPDNQNDLCGIPCSQTCTDVWEHETSRQSNVWDGEDFHGNQLNGVIYGIMNELILSPVWVEKQPHIRALHVEGHAPRVWHTLAMFSTGFQLLNKLQAACLNQPFAVFLFSGFAAFVMWC